MVIELPNRKDFDRPLVTANQQLIDFFQRGKKNGEPGRKKICLQEMRR
jgi:hypothetical protein